MSIGFDEAIKMTYIETPATEIKRSPQDDPLRFLENVGNGT